jgi:transcriptional regulator with XRE-family HTH domain
VANQLRHLVLTRLAELGTPGHPMSARQAAERSGGGVSFHTLYAIANGRHSGRLTGRTAQGIADALEVPVSQVYDAAGVPRPQERWLPPEKLDRLSLEQRRLLEAVGVAMLDAYTKGYEQGASDTQ